MAIAKLDSNFTLLNLLKLSSTCQVYRGCNTQGHPVLVKVLNQPKQFFDEMARYLVLDQAESIPYLHANYPPRAYAGKDFLKNRAIWETIDFYWDLYRQNHPENHIAWNEEQIGILVTDWVDGSNLAEVWHHFDPTRRIAIARNLACSLSEIHTMGECHGNLQLDHIMVEKDSDTIKLVGLGYFPEKQLSAGSIAVPELTGRGTPTVGPASDVFLFGKLILQSLGDWEGHSLIGACLDTRPEKRPHIEKVQRFLKGVSQQKPFYQTHKGLAKYLFSIAVLASLAFFLNFKSSWGGPPSSPNLPFTPSPGLAKLLQDTQKTNIRAGGELQQADLFLDEYDLHRPIAVLVFQRKVMLIGRDQTYSEGDQVQYRGQIYRISQLSPCHIQLSQFDQHLSIPFDPPTDNYFPTAADTGVYIWDNPNNFGRFLHGLAEVLPIIQPQAQGPVSQLLKTMVSVGDYHIEVPEGRILGSFKDGNINRFLTHLEQLIHYRIDTDRVHVYIEGPQVRI